MPFSVYGNAIIPPVAPITDGTGGPIFNGPHAADPSWNSLIKMVSNSTENNGPQTVIVPFFYTDLMRKLCLPPKKALLGWTWDSPELKVLEENQVAETKFLFL